MSFLGVCMSESEFVIVTELLQGGTLYRALKNGKVNWYRRWGAPRFVEARGEQLGVGQHQRLPCQQVFEMVWLP